MPKPSKPASPSELVSKCVSALASGKRHYKKSDAAMDALEKVVKAGEVVTIEAGKLKGKQFKLVDKFEGKNRIGVGLSARRYELEEITPP